MIRWAQPHRHRTGRVAAAILVVLCAAAVEVGAYRVIDQMTQTVDGKQVLVKGRIQWTKGVAIDVYIPRDPTGSGAEREVQAAFNAWAEKLRTETNAEITFNFHVGEAAPAPGPNDPPPYVVEVNWTDSGSTDEPGSATVTTNVTPNADGTYQRSGDAIRGSMNVNRNNPAGDPYNLTAIYNIALHEVGHILGLDHKTPEQQSVVMEPTGADDPEGKNPLKDDDARGLQDLYGKKPGSSTPPTPPADGGSGDKCCAFECGGVFGCAMVWTQQQCDSYGGVIQSGVCTATSEEERSQGGPYGRCEEVEPEDETPPCPPTPVTGHYIAAPMGPGLGATYTLVLSNSGCAAALVSASLSLPSGFVAQGTWASGEGSLDVATGRLEWGGCVPPGGEIRIEAVGSWLAAPESDALTSFATVLDLASRDATGYAAEPPAGSVLTAPAIPDEIEHAARLLAWESGHIGRTNSSERWTAKESSPADRCAPCGGAPMCLVCMESDLDVWKSRSKSAEERAALNLLTPYLRSVRGAPEYSAVAAIYWDAYWDGYHNRDRPTS
jgi:hypothetical protein